MEGIDMSWTRAIDLNHWADTQDARHKLPTLLRKLVRATIPKEHIQTINFPSEEQVQRTGLDGVVEVTQGNQFVPNGKSAWEAGTNKNKKAKADGDFKKRTDKQQEDETYVFVTPRTWQTKDQWAEEQKNGSRWKDVTVLDANDLEHWLELAPAVDLWLSTLMGRRPQGITDIDRYWQALASISDVALMPQVFLTARETATKSVTQFLQHPASSAFLRCEGWDDGIDFLAALIASNEADLVCLDRFIIVSEIEAWRYLASSLEPVVLVAASSLVLSATDVADAVNNGHHVLVTGARTTIQATEIAMPRQDHSQLYQALAECGFDEARARSYALGCCGSSSILKRLITKHPDRSFPKWSQNDHRAKLAPFSLLGGWTHVDPEPPSETDPLGINRPPLDLWCVEQFGLSREEIEEAVTRWGTGEEPLFIQIGNSVLVGSREDAWYLLGGSLSTRQLKRFQDVANLILDEDNPALELDPDKRWMANLYGKVHSLSGELRRSVVETLALMSCYPTARKPAATIDFSATVRAVLDNVLPEKAPWQRWASLGSNLVLLAECDPEFVLGRIEADLAADAPPQLLKLFEGTSNALFSSHSHCDVLWALEGLAWSPEHLGRVALICAQIAARLHDFQSGNSPMNSLQEIFLLWLPHTNASIDDRIAAIERIVTDEPAIGWELITKLLPGTTVGISSGTHMPRWRPWAHGWSKDLASAQTASYASQFGDMALRLAGTDVKHWSRIIEGMLRLGGVYTERIIERLNEIASIARNSMDECYELWDTLRQITCRHGRFPKASWAFSERTLEQLTAIRDQIEPQDDPVLQHGWLFHQKVQLPDVDERDYRKHDQTVADRRRDALKKIVANKGIRGVHDLLARAGNAQAIGHTLGANSLVSPTGLDIPKSLEAEDDSMRVCALSYCGNRFWMEEWSFVEQLPVKDWTAEQAAALAACFRFERATWEWIASISHEAETDYWRQCRAYLRKPTMKDVDYAIEKLLQVGRTFAAADFVHTCMGKDFSLDDGRILILLEKGLERQSKEDAQRTDCYAIQELIGQLQKSSDVDKGRVARIEWGYLPVLDRFAQVKPRTLLKALCDEPQLFYDLLERRYPAEDEEPGADPPPDDEQNVARLAHELFEQFNVIPGIQEDGTIDGSALNDWIDQVRALANKGKRLSVCDIRIGTVLSHCPIPKQLDPNSHTVLAAIERVGSKDVFDGFYFGTINNRGATTRMPTTGGEPERRLVEKYRTIAKNCQAQYPQVANMFKEIAGGYERDARMHDESAVRTRLGR